jgi:hypothetical protein
MNQRRWVGESPLLLITLRLENVASVSGQGDFLMLSSRMDRPVGSASQGRPHPTSPPPTGATGTESAIDNCFLETAHFGGKGRGKGRTVHSC